jgi:hypothetical protein
MLSFSTVPNEKFFEGGTTDMSTLAVVEEILRETAVPMSVREIVERAGARLPSKSKTPDTVVARDLSMDIKKKGEASLFVRTSPGRYTLRALAPAAVTDGAPIAAQPLRVDGARPPQPMAGPPLAAQPMSALPARKPAVAAAPSSSPARTRTEGDVGNGLAG